MDLIALTFNEFKIAKAVWEELTAYEHPSFDRSLLTDIEPRVLNSNSKNQLRLLTDRGEAESVLLYHEIGADILLIDNQRARLIAESLGVNCIGTLGLMLKAKEKGLIEGLKPYFEKWLMTGRYFSKRLLNGLLSQSGESEIS